MSLPDVPLPSASEPGSPDAAAIGRFRDACAALSATPEAGRPLGLAVSGGPDSMALLTLGAAAFPGCVIAAGVDHGLRPASAEEAAMVARHCGAIGVPHATLRAEGLRDGPDLQARARDARYALLARWARDAGALAVATAHHADDQAETFLMRAARGAGVSGLAGIRARTAQPVTDRVPGQWPERVVHVEDRWNVPVVRPLLGWLRDELRALVEAAGVPFVEDPSNADDRFERTRFRQWLAAAPDVDPRRIARSAQQLAEIDAELRAFQDWAWRLRRLPGPHDEVRLNVADLPRELRRRLVRDAIGSVRMISAIVEGEFDSASGNIESLLEALEAGRAATLAGVKARPDGGIWHFAQAPPRRSH